MSVGQRVSRSTFSIAASISFLTLGMSCAQSEPSEATGSGRCVDGVVQLTGTDGLEDRGGEGIGGECSEQVALGEHIYNTGCWQVDATRRGPITERMSRRNASDDFSYVGVQILQGIAVEQAVLLLTRPKVCNERDGELVALSEDMGGGALLTLRRKAGRPWPNGTDTDRSLSGMRHCCGK